MERRSRRGVQPGTRLRNNAASYDPESGRPYLVSGRFDDPAEAMKLIRAAEASGVSVAEILRRAIRFMPVDESGRPTWDSVVDAGTAPEQLQLAIANRRERAA